jgi:integrase
MGLYRRGKVFWFTIKHDGKRIQESTGTENRKLAEKIFAKVFNEIIEGTWFEKQKALSLTFKDMTEKYLNKYCKIRDEQTVRKLLPSFGHLTLSEVTTEVVSDYRDERLKTVKPATVYQELSLMRRMFNVARREWKWIKDNPVADLSFSVGNSNARYRWLTLEEEKLLLECASPEWLKNLITFALHTGMRRGEIINLLWKDVDFQGRLLRIEKSKNGEKRSVPMSKTVCELLRGMKVREITGQVFSVTQAALKDGFERAVKKACINDFHFHDLRHTFATRLVQNGIDIYVVKELLGHKTITMTMRYAHHYPESLRHGVEVLDRLCYNCATVEASDICLNVEKSFKINCGSA